MIINFVGLRTGHLTCAAKPQPCFQHNSISLSSELRTRDKNLTFVLNRISLSLSIQSESEILISCPKFRAQANAIIKLFRSKRSYFAFYNTSPVHEYSIVHS